MRIYNEWYFLPYRVVSTAPLSSRNTKLLLYLIFFLDSSSLIFYKLHFQLLNLHSSLYYWIKELYRHLKKLPSLYCRQIQGPNANIYLIFLWETNSGHVKFNFSLGLLFLYKQCIDLVFYIEPFCMNRWLYFWGAQPPSQKPLMFFIVGCQLLYAKEYQT